MSEKRSYLRVNKSFYLQFKIRGKEEVYEATTYDISLGGIGFFSPVEINENSILHIRMNVPGFDEALALRGIVRWKKKVDDKKTFLGVEFYNIDSKERDIILKSLREENAQENTNQIN